MRKLFIFLFIFFGSYFSKGSTLIQCNNLDYAGQKLDFFQYSDPIAKESQYVFSLEFDKNGKCNSRIEITTTSYVFCDFGIYRGMLFLVPGETIKLQLPPLREKSFAEEKNPYFSPLTFWFASANKEILNNQISGFTQQLNRLTDKFFNELYFRQSKEIYDSVVFLLDKEFSKNKSETFIFHKKMKIKMVEAEAFRQKPEQIAHLFSNISQQFWLHPSFVDFLEKTFSAQLSFEAKSIKGKELADAVNKSNITFLQKFVKTKYKVSTEMADLVLLKLLHDGFYSGDFSKNSILKMIESELFSKHSNNIIKRSSQLIVSKLTHLQRGLPAPPICLNTIEGTQVCTNKNTDKFKYLVFADIEMIVCREQLKQLENIERRFQKHIEIFIVLKNTEPAELKKYFDENKIAGIKLIDANNEFIKKYKIKSFPQSYLLSENHKVEFASAKNPLEGFEQQFGKFIQRELFERQRNQSR